MQDILDSVLQALDAGRRVALATVIRVERSAPRGPGAAMALDEQGNVYGSVSGGCVEGDLYMRLQAVLESGRPELVPYGISDEQGFEVGLSCGGTIHVFTERLDGLDGMLKDYAAAIKEGRPAALVTVLNGPAMGAKLIVTEDAVTGTSGDAALDRAIVDASRSLLEKGRSGVERLAGEGATREAGQEDRTEVFILSHVPPARLFVFGATDFARALCTVGKLLDFYVVACDAREPFATRERFPDADEVLHRWPHDVLEEADLGPRDAVCVLTHDSKFDVPALKVALNRPTGYVGALGSRRTQARRREALLEAGVTEEQIARIAAPIGLDIGAETPAEFAVAVLGEIIAKRRGRSGGSLSTGKERIHAAAG